MKLKTKSPTSAEGRYAYEGLDRLIHERARLGVLTCLITNPKGLTFVELKQLCSLTDGNLSRHLSILEKDKMVILSKGYDRNYPQTICRVTPSGRKRYLEYLATLEQVIRDATTVTREHLQADLPSGLVPIKA